VTQKDKPRRPPRFYKTVDVAPVAGGFGVRLDGRAAKTPGGAPLSVPAEPLADLIAQEWQTQDKEIDLSLMPATRLAFTAIDRTPLARAELAQEVARYAGSDLICYLADEPPTLAQRQAAAWGPWLTWAQDTLSVTLIPAVGIAPVQQPVEALATVEAHAAALDDFRLTAVTFAAGLFGSAVLALAVARGALSGEEAYEVSRLDEAFQQEQWGVDCEAAARTAILRMEAAMVERWFAALRRA
jgi:chaperone required for assembly of F1-ATPase